MKSERWNSAVFEVALCMAARELRAELVNVRTIAGRRLQAAGVALQAVLGAADDGGA